MIVSPVNLHEVLKISKPAKVSKQNLQTVKNFVLKPYIIASAITANLINSKQTEKNIVINRVKKDAPNFFEYISKNKKKITSASCHYNKTTNTQAYNLKTENEEILIDKNKNGKIAKIVTKFMADNGSTIWCTDIVKRDTNKYSRQLYVLYPNGSSEIFDSVVDSHKGMTPLDNKIIANVIKGKNNKPNKFIGKNLNNVYSIMEYNGSKPYFKKKCQQNKKINQLIENIKKTPLNCDIHEALLEYKGKKGIGCFENIQKELRTKYSDSSYKIDETIQKNIDNIASYIETQPLPQNIKLYRGGGFYGLNNLELENGETIDLGNIMNTVAKSKNPEEINKVREFILDHEITAFKPGFLSTSLDKSAANLFSLNFNGGTRVLYHFDIEPNTKGVYLEALNTVNRFSEQREVLIQKSSKIKLEDVKYDMEFDVWDIKAKISN